MQTIYDKQMNVLNPSAVIDRVNEISRKVNEEYDKETVDQKEVLRLRTAQLMVAMQLSTRGGTRFF